MTTPGNQPEEAGSNFRLITAGLRTRELTGAVDLVGHHGLRNYHETFCQKPLSASIGESRYLKNVVGDIDIRKGEGMELGQLLGSDSDGLNAHIHEFNMDVLQQAFTLRESGSLSLPEADRGIPTISMTAKEQPKEKDRKHKKHKKHKVKHKDRDKDKDNDRHKERDKEKERSREKDRRKKKENGEDSTKKHHKKRRKHDGEEEGEGQKHKKKKHKHSSKAEIPEQLVKG